MGDAKTANPECVEGKLKKLQLSKAEKKGIRIGRKQACSSKVSKLQAVDKDKALDGGPLTFNIELLVMEDFVPSKTIDEYEYKMIPIWVRAHGIPMGMMSRETSDLIGEQIGEVLDVDLDDSGDAMGDYMWIEM
ncbi:hypothetical protein ACQ4PT_028702 [Festuca glaucescens]